MFRAAQGRFAISLYLVFLCVIALAGGSSRFDAASQPVVRLAAILLIAALSLGSQPQVKDAHRPAFWFLGALGLLVLLQLLPLPPALWRALPGRARYLAAAVAAGERQPWRPLNLTPDRGWNTLFALLPPAATLYAATRLRMRDQAPVLIALAAIVMVSAVIGLAQVSSGADDALRFYAAPPTGSAVGLFANRNHQALLIVCGLPMLGLLAERALADRAKARLHGAIALVSGVFLVLMIPTTGSRAGLALAAVALLFSLALAWPAVRRATATLSPRQRAIAIGGGLAALALLLWAALTFARAESVRRLFAIDPADDARIKLLRPLFTMIRDFFPLGSGFGSFDPVYRGYEPFGNLAVTYMNQAHDDYLQIVMEAGLPGLALLILFIGWWGWTATRLWRAGDGESRALGRLGSVIILLIMLASIADYPVRTPLMMVIAAQAAAWMLLPRNRRNGFDQPDHVFTGRGLAPMTRSPRGSLKNNAF